MPVTSFRVSIVLKNQTIFDRLAVKLTDFSTVFDHILDRWLAHNEDKFAQAQGAEADGISFASGDATWKPDTKKYSAAKRRAGFPDWLMVRTGETKDAMTERGAMGQYEEIEPMQAQFSLTDDPRDRARWNMETRPVMFLDDEDQLMIREMFGAYLNDESPFRAYRFPDSSRMEAEFGAILNPIGG